MLPARPNGAIRVTTENETPLVTEHGLIADERHRPWNWTTAQNIASPHATRSRLGRDDNTLSGTFTFRTAPNYQRSSTVSYNDT